jgi:DNA polymerase III delta prime subunit
MNIHSDIKKKLDYFIKQKKIPNIIFHGVSGCGKNALVSEFVNNVYGGDKHAIQTYVMNVNCAHGKGIRFIREDLKFFSKTNVDLRDGDIFKTVILLNADKLTIDAQSAIRRCIELFSRSTRFFIIVEDKYKLLRPILSRFCEIYIPEPVINGAVVNLHEYNLNKIYDFKLGDSKRRTYIKTALGNFIKKKQSIDSNVVVMAEQAIAEQAIAEQAIAEQAIAEQAIAEQATAEQATAEQATAEQATAEQATAEQDDNINQNNQNNVNNVNNEMNKNIILDCMLLITKLYNKGYCSIDLIHYIEHSAVIEELKKYEYLITYQKIKREFRNEKLLMLFILYFLIFRSDLTLENISFM